MRFILEQCQSSFGEALDDVGRFGEEKFMMHLN